MDVEAAALEGSARSTSCISRSAAPVRLTMTSEDVIHSFYVPASAPSRTCCPAAIRRLWFHPTKPGKYHLFCAEYCGTKHSGMIGWVYVMDPQEYEAWLSCGAGEGSRPRAATSCFRTWHAPTATRPTAAAWPSLQGVYGKTVELEMAARKSIADDDYLRESILSPQAKIVKGYQPIMPTFQGLVTEERLCS